MAYLTVDEVKTLFPALNAQVVKGTVSSTRVESWIEDAESIIDSYLASRFDLPFDDVPKIVKSLARGFFEYFWQKDVATPTSTGYEVPWLYGRYDRLLDQLKKIASGETSIVDDVGEILEPSTERIDQIRSNHQAVDQIFSMQDSWEQEIDSEYDEEPDA